MGRAETTRTGRQAPPAWLEHEDLNLPPILAAALADFQQHGYHGATVRGIAGRAGATMTSLYYHYGNKEGILFALLDIAMDDQVSHIHLALEAAGDDTLTRFRNAITAVALHATRRHDLAVLHSEFRFLGVAMREKYVAKRALVEQALEDLLKRGMAEGLFVKGDSHFTTRLLLDMVGGIVGWYREDGPLSAQEIAERYTQAAVRFVSSGTVG
ncbi:TetR/AcrR family transcriptional regulator [Nocardia aurantia]|uniref:HTH-type transcriptional repressor KstR2 n=1 Tax=Nocardia aurantia TaxID=2585199 RepID=A0A7K0E180_9NOCA|nr:TetR/AcrR family transcriptional regulator [Nocardia aurantia]MQY31846.1 HTH-type transcriptional repressor KstR2 [Nocardia aurantia]